MKTKLLLAACIGLQTIANAQELTFNPENFTEKQLTMPDGYTVKYKAYENICYVKNVQDSVNQTLNIYVPEKQRNNSPIFVRTYVGGYMSARAKGPSANDASGRALEEGYIVCIPGSRGSNSFIHKDILNKRKKPTGEFETIYTGKAPAAILDLKAAIRFLKANDEAIPGNSQKIITDGTSAGGALSALLGATGNHADYEQLLSEMGAAKASDEIWAAVCYCPITDLEHADMAYEWLYKNTNKTVRGFSQEQDELSKKLAEKYPEYLNSLNLRNPESGESITDKNYLNYLKTWLFRSVNMALNENGDIPENPALNFYDESKESRFLISMDIEKYLEYVASEQKLKTVPAFDSQNILGKEASAENKLFGMESGLSLNFTEFIVGHILPSELHKRVKMMNPMHYLAGSQTIATKNWYIRHGAKDRDTGFQTSLNLATLLANKGCNVDFFMPWEKGHSGDYDLNSLFDWLESLD